MTHIIRVIDFETTGEAPPAEVCEVGFTDLHLSETGDSGEAFLCGPSSWLCGVSEMPPTVRAVHHITLQDCQGHDPFSPEQLDHGLVDAFAAHNAKFEQQFFQTDKPFICTYKAALRVWPDAPSHSNGVLRYWLEDQGLTSPDPKACLPAHRAGPDTYVTAWLLKALFESGATGKDMVAWTKEPALLKHCPIGKQRGETWARIERGFLDWMLKQPGMEEDLKWLARRELQIRRGAA